MVSEFPVPEGYSLAPAAAADLEGIAEIYNEVVLTGTASFDRQPRPVEYWRHKLSASGGAHPLFAVREDASGTVAAWGSLSPWSEKEAYSRTAEVSIYVAAAHRGKRLGTLLLSLLIREARASGLHMLISRIAEGNAASMALHRRFDFRHIGTMREAGFKFGRYLDVELLELRVNDPETV